MNPNLSIELVMFLYVPLVEISMIIKYDILVSISPWPWRLILKMFSSLKFPWQQTETYLSQKTIYFRLSHFRYYFQQDPLIWHKELPLHFKGKAMHKHGGRTWFQNCTPCRSGVMKSLVPKLYPIQDLCFEVMKRVTEYTHHKRAHSRTPTDWGHQHQNQCNASLTGTIIKKTSCIIFENFWKFWKFWKSLMSNREFVYVALSLRMFKWVPTGSRTRDLSHMATPPALREQRR
jgi:hypothetical protein